MKRFSYAMMLLAVAGWGCGSSGSGGNAGTMGLGTAGVSANQPGAGMLGNAGMGFAGQQASGGTNSQPPRPEAMLVWLARKRQ